MIRCDSQGHRNDSGERRSLCGSCVCRCDIAAFTHVNLVLNARCIHLLHIDRNNLGDSNRIVRRQGTWEHVLHVHTFTAWRTHNGNVNFRAISFTKLRQQTYSRTHTTNGWMAHVDNNQLWEKYTHTQSHSHCVWRVDGFVRPKSLNHVRVVAQ